jgi:type IV fimbrial biogenesis protein FimT
MRQRTDTGLSLAEFTITVTLLGAVLLLTAPLLYRIAHDQRASEYTNDLVSTLTYARVQAVTRGQAVTVCASADGRQCTDTPWAQGYLVFLDEQSPGVVDTREVILKRVGGGDRKIVVTLQGGRYVRFSRLGTLSTRALVEDSAPQGVAQWLDRLSPIATAQADTSHSDTAGPERYDGGGAVRQGTFTVCYQQIGRLVTLSLQGRVTTRPTACPRRS